MRSPRVEYQLFPKLAEPQEPKCSLMERVKRIFFCCAPIGPLHPLELQPLVKNEYSHAQVEDLKALMVDNRKVTLHLSNGSTLTLQPFLCTYKRAAGIKEPFLARIPEGLDGKKLHEDLQTFNNRKEILEDLILKGDQVRIEIPSA